MKRGNTLADLLPASTKKQLLDIKKNYKPVPKIDNKHSLANFELDRSERDHLIKKQVGTEDLGKVMLKVEPEAWKALSKENAVLRKDITDIMDEKIELKNRITQLERIIKDSCAKLMKEII